MRIHKGLQCVIVAVVLTILVLSGMQMMMERNYYTVKSVNTTTAKVTPFKGRGLAGTREHRITEVNTMVEELLGSGNSLQDDSVRERTRLPKHKQRQVLVTSSISKVKTYVRKSPETDKHMEKPYDNGEIVFTDSDELIEMLSETENTEETASSDTVGQNIKKPLTREEKRAIFEPVKTVFGAALFNFSNFHPVDFRSEKPVIPHIIHQIWDTYNVPVMFKKWIQSIVDQHPDWEYWFWSVSDAECLIRKKYPQYLSMFQRYPQNIFRTDAFRYFVLYDYGGFYIDLDVEALKPLDFWTYYYPAVISWENYEHTYLSHKKKEPNIMTTVLASRPKHPFFKKLQLDLVKNAVSRDVLQATGPFFLHRTYKSYMTTHQSTLKDSNITTIHPKYWLPKHDNYVETRNSCNMLYNSLTVHGRAMCDELKKDHHINSIKPDSFLNHFWVHVNMWHGAKRGRMTRSVFHIKDLIPNVKLMSDMLKC